MPRLLRRMALYLLGTTAPQRLTSAKQIHVNVSDAHGAHTFSPASAKADVGDILTFHFFGGRHDVVRGVFDMPCTPAAENGFYSGELEDGDGGEQEKEMVFSVRVRDEEPIWFFCSVGGHCGSGMVGVVNAPKDGPTLADYASISAGARTGDIPLEWKEGFGGVLSSEDDDLPTDHDNAHDPAETSGEGEGEDTDEKDGLSRMLSTITSTTFNTIVATTTDSEGNTVTTSYITAVGTGMSIVEATITAGADCEGRNCTAIATKTGSGAVISPVPSWDAASANLDVERRGWGGLLGILSFVFALL